MCHAASDVDAILEMLIAKGGVRSTMLSMSNTPSIVTSKQTGYNRPLNQQH